MKHVTTSTRLATIGSAAALAVLTLIACDSKPAQGTAPRPAPTHDHKPGENHDHGQGDGHDHGPTTQLGQQEVGGFTIKASRDGSITAGKDAPIDAWITGPKPAAVRFWIGTQDAKGSIKARAELEKDNWHTHVEVPSPLPEGSKLWIEVQTDKGEKLAAGFDLQA